MDSLQGALIGGTLVPLWSNSVGYTVQAKLLELKAEVLAQGLDRARCHLSTHMPDNEFNSKVSILGRELVQQLNVRVNQELNGEELSWAKALLRGISVRFLGDDFKLFIKQNLDSDQIPPPPKPWEKV